MHVTIKYKSNYVRKTPNWKYVFEILHGMTRKILASRKYNW